jgi:hypothetical protein
MLFDDFHPTNVRTVEFAKEAMTCQALDQAEVLSIRWARDDPNPLAQEAISKADKDALAALLQAKGISIEAAPFNYPTDYQVPAAKRMRLEDGTEVTTDKPDLAYPDTDNQYQAAYAVGGQTMTAEEYAAYCEAYYADYYAKQGIQPQPTGLQDSQPAPVGHSVSTNNNQSKQNDVDKQKASLLSAFVGLDETPALANTLPISTNAVVAATSSVAAAAAVVAAAAAAAQGKTVAEVAVKEKEEDNDESDSEDDGDDEEDDDGPEWTEHLDPDTGATYYYNRFTGESSWGAPPADTQSVVATEASKSEST